ncbi:MAG: hypothetical protein ACP5G1_04720, partial [Nanopusillaceae archaeon]
MGHKGLPLYIIGIASFIAYLLANIVGPSFSEGFGNSGSNNFIGYTEFVGKYSLNLSTYGFSTMRENMTAEGVIFRYDDSIGKYINMSSGKVIVEILNTNDSSVRFLGISINSPLHPEWWRTGNYTCSYYVDPSRNITSRFECDVPGGIFKYAEASISSDEGYVWQIELIYPNGTSFTCVVDRNTVCPPGYNITNNQS